MVTLTELQTRTVNLPVIGAISIVGLVVAGALIFFLARRKKTIGIRV